MPRPSKKRTPHPRIIAQRATPERIAKPLTEAVIGADSVQRITDAPLAWLASRGFLDRSDSERNRLLFEAGEEYRRHWYTSGLSPISAIDPARPMSHGEADAFLPATENQAWHRQQYRRGAEALGQYFSVVVDAVVLEERNPEDIGRQITRYSNAKLCRTIALDRLTEGLRRLAVAYGFLDPHDGLDDSTR